MDEFSSTILNLYDVLLLRHSFGWHEIVIIPADKAHATVLLDRFTHKDKMQELLTDTSTYERITKGLIKKEVRTLNA